MKISQMDHMEYCGLNRPRFWIDPVEDAQCYFGNQEVAHDLQKRIDNDIVVRGVPKCGVCGRYGGGKTHTLHFIKYQVDNLPGVRPIECFVVQLEPYDEKGPEGGGWKFIHDKLLDSMGENFIRDIMRKYDKKVEDKSVDLSEHLHKLFKFGDENMKTSLANLLSGSFVRVTKSTVSAWQWLRAEKGEKGAASELGTIKSMANAEDMISVILNLGVLVRFTIGKGLLFLIDEAQGLNDVEKKEKEIHYAFRKLADAENQDVGFIIAYQGDGQHDIPKVLLEPDDIISRLGATSQNLESAFIDLGRLINGEERVRGFINSFCETIHDKEKAEAVIKKYNIPKSATWRSLPFTEEALDRIAHIIWGNELWRNPRMIISELARLAADVYNQGKVTNKYVLADKALVDSSMESAA